MSEDWGAFGSDNENEFNVPQVGDTKSADGGDWGDFGEPEPVQDAKPKSDNNEKSNNSEGFGDFDEPQKE
jgi:hypothetical protein